MASKDTSRRVGLTPGRVVDCAEALTSERGLHNWSIRDLAAALDVVPSVIYHYFPTKTDIHDSLRDRICASLVLPDEQLPWDRWFTEALTSLRHTLLRYNGLTRHLVASMEAGSPPQPLMPLFETAIGKLTEAGLGAHTAPAYAMIINVALGAIEQRDRQSSQSSNRHDISTMVDNLSPLAEQSPALAMLRDDYLNHLHQESGAEISERYYQLLLRSLLTGITSVLAPDVTPSPQPPRAPGHV